MIHFRSRISNTYILLKEALLACYPYCEVCGVRRSIEVNHCLYHKHGGVFDSFENCQAVCTRCHATGRAHTRAKKIRHWNTRVAQGFDMEKWNENIPETRKENYE